MKKNWLIALLLVGVVIGALFVFSSYTDKDPGKLDSTDTKSDSASDLRVVIFSYVNHPVLDLVRDSFKEKLSNLASQSSRKVNFVDYNADGIDGQLASLSRVILQSEFDLAVPIATPVSVQLIRDASVDRPILYSFVTNPENLGAGRFEKNVTGVSDVVNYPANVSLIFDWMHEVKTIGMLFNPSEPNSVDAVERVRPLVEKREAKLRLVEVAGGEHVATAAQNLAPYVDAFYIGGDNTVVGAAKDLIMVAKRNGKPVFASDSGSVANGAVAAVSVDYKEIGIETANTAWQILSTEKKPRDIPPVSVSGKTVLYNPNSLEALSLTVPESYATRARSVN